MADRTKISWAEATWSPVTGCTRVSDGCLHCYIARTPPIRMAGRSFDDPGIGATLAVQLHPTRLEQPMRWSRPRRIFVCSQADLFHEGVPNEFIAKMWAVMIAAPQHTYLVLTKRPARMRSLLNSSRFRVMIGDAAREMQLPDTAIAAVDVAVQDSWPLPNVWLGVTAENQHTADMRIPILLGTPATIRFVSAEPLLSPVDLSALPPRPHTEQAREIPTSTWVGALAHASSTTRAAKADPVTIDWLICGGESGPGARPMQPQWAQSLRDQCTRMGIAFHFKQWGEWAPHLDHEDADHTVDVSDSGDHAQGMRRVGKNLAGRLLDGQLHDDYPNR